MKDSLLEWLKARIVNKLGKFLNLLPAQLELSGTLGGIKVLFQRIGIYLAFINWIMVSRVFWESSVMVQQIFLGNYWFFLFGGLGAIALVALLFEYMIIYPSEVKFQQHQISKKGRSPIFEGIKRTERKVEKLEGRLGNLESVAKNELEHLAAEIEKLRREDEKSKRTHPR